MCSFCSISKPVVESMCISFDINELTVPYSTAASLRADDMIDTIEYSEHNQSNDDVLMDSIQLPAHPLPSLMESSLANPLWQN